MNDYRLLFEPAASDGLPHIMDVRARDLDAAEDTAKAYLAMLGESYHSCTVFEQWRTMWRGTGHRIVFSPNL